MASPVLTVTFPGAVLTLANPPTSVGPIHIKMYIGGADSNSENVILSEGSTPGTYDVVVSSIGGISYPTSLEGYMFYNNNINLFNFILLDTGADNLALAELAGIDPTQVTIVGTVESFGGGGDTGGGGGTPGTGVVTFPYILQQDAGATLDVAGETVTNSLVPHVTLDYYGIDFSNVFSQSGTDQNRVAVSLAPVDSSFLADVSGFLSDVEQSLRTFNKWLGGYDHREFESTACTSLEGLTAGLEKITAADYNSNVFEQLVGIDASAVSVDGATSAMTFDFTNINEFHVVSRVSTTYAISIDTAKAFSISGVPATITVDYASANPVEASRPWYVLTRIHRAAGTNAISYDETGTAPDA